MAFQAAITKLQSPIKDLVLSVTQNGASLAGNIEKDQTEVVAWIEKVGQGDLVKDTNIKDLDKELVPRTYIVSNYLTAADVALYGALHPVISKHTPQQYYSYPSITRYFDHIQSCSPVRTASDASNIFPLVSFNLQDAPKLERTAEPPKKKEKAPKASAVVDEPKSVPSTSEPVEKAPKKEKKEKKETAAQDGGKKEKKAGGGGGGKAAPVDDGEPVPSMIDLRVGHIVDIMKHPDADGLYVEQIDIGEETGPRTVVSGLVNYIPIEDMRDKYLVAVCNLKPANMRGVKSFAMVLCATSKDGKEAGIELIQPPANSKPGDRVYFEGADFENAAPLSQLNPKKKIFETIQPGFITLDSREAAWVNPQTASVHKIRTKEGVCIAPSLVGASLS
ncbi:hypothetical protein C8J56DRAFT_999750 [Mycena floridula]|nr:hypothetical protein C8J56DRAFT_999750 [Mycena floridula]